MIGHGSRVLNIVAASLIAALSAGVGAAAWAQQPPPPGAPSPAAAIAGVDNTNLSLSEVERLYIRRIIQEEGGRIERAAQRLGVPRSSLYKKIKAMGISVSKAPQATL